MITRTNTNNTINTMTLKEAAMEYTAHGIAVFPIEPRGTRTARGYGFYDATTDVSKVEAWWTENPRYNIGCLLDKNTVAIDFTNANGNRSIREFQEAHGGFSPFASCIASKQDSMIFFKVESPVRPCVNAYDGIDILANPCFVLLPPSISKSTGRLQWKGDLSIIDELPVPNTSAMKFMTSTAEEQGKKASIFSHAHKYLAPEDWKLPVTSLNDRFWFLSDQLDQMTYILGYSDEETRKMVFELNRKHCDPPFDEKLIKDHYHFFKFGEAADLNDYLGIDAINLPHVLPEYDTSGRLVDCWSPLPTDSLKVLRPTMPFRGRASQSAIMDELSEFLKMCVHYT